jgi:hypothetical protein
MAGCGQFWSSDAVQGRQTKYEFEARVAGNPPAIDGRNLRTVTMYNRQARQLVP